MADKEQRYALIAIPETDREETRPFYSVCDGVDDCGVLGLKYTTYKVCIAGITRAEAVEKMATALCQKAKNTEDCKLCSICWEEGCNRCDFSDFAEAALDAVLCKDVKNEI